MSDIDDMGFLAEDACRELAAAISPDAMVYEREPLVQALRRFMNEAKKPRGPIP